MSVIQSLYPTFMMCPSDMGVEVLVPLAHRDLDDSPREGSIFAIEHCGRTEQVGGGRVVL
jgi:hypothetical protein